MRILVTADIHLGYDRAKSGDERFLHELSKVKNIDAIVVAGDIAENGPESTHKACKHHRRVFELLTATGCPNIAILAGSHDIWAIENGPDSWELLMNTLHDLCREFGFTYLERDNLYVDDIAVVGTMAHYDYSMAEEDLIINGMMVKLKHYKKNTPPGYDKPVWGDAKFLRWDYDDITVCNMILNDFEKRLKTAIDKVERIIVASHTVPIPDVNGHIFKTNLKNRFLNAFSGTNLLNEIILRNNSSGKITDSVSGHTHIRIKPIKKDGITYRNIGGDYGKPRYDILIL